MSIKLIIGLRNPGLSYAETRHNAGGWFVEALSNDHRCSFKTEKKMNAEIARLNTNDAQCILMMPSTYMNQSGLSVRAVCQFYRLQPQELLVAHDELDLPPGRIKLKFGGGHGGHNGLRDIIKHLGSNEFHRLRVGIGHPGHKELVLNYVLGKPSLSDKQSIMKAVDRAIDAMPNILAGDMAKAMNALHN